jgi:hypothetical protein
MNRDPDPNALYDVVPMKKPPFGPRDWWTVTSNGIPHRHFADRDKAERYATDPEWRAEIREAEAKQRGVRP